MKLISKRIAAELPKLYGTRKDDDPIAHLKLFTPWTYWTWYAVEFDGEDLFFGLVQGHEEEFGYFSLSELESLRGPGRLRVERDKWFDPAPLSEVRLKRRHENIPTGTKR